MRYCYECNSIRISARSHSLTCLTILTFDWLPCDLLNIKQVLSTSPAMTLLICLAISKTAFSSGFVENADLRTADNGMAERDDSRLITALTLIAMLYQPSIAQLVERGTVVVHSNNP